MHLSIWACNFSSSWVLSFIFEYWGLPFLIWQKKAICQVQSPQEIYIWALWACALQSKLVWDLISAPACCPGKGLQREHQLLVVLLQRHKLLHNGGRASLFLSTAGWVGRCQTYKDCGVAPAHCCDRAYVRKCTTGSTFYPKSQLLSKVLRNKI